MKGNYIFTYSRLLNNEIKIPNDFIIDETGYSISLSDYINNINNLDSTVRYLGDNVELTFKTTLSSIQETELNSIIESYKNKNMFSNIENYILTYNLLEEKLSVDFDNLINSIELEYNNIGWNNLTDIEKRICSKLFISSNIESLNHYSQLELDSFRYFKIYRLLTTDKCKSMNKCDWQVTPQSIDYKKDLRQRLHPEYTFDSYGFLTDVTYYEKLSVTLDPQGFSIFNFSIPILNYNAVYTLGLNGYVESRNITRKWILSDDTYSDDIKTSFKIYEPLKARNEGRIRRKNIINNLLINVVGLLVLTSNDLNNVIEAEQDAIGFMRDINSSISDYYESGTKSDISGTPCQLIQDVTNHTYSRLNNFVPNTGDTLDIRNYIINTLNY